MFLESRVLDVSSFLLFIIATLRNIWIWICRLVNESTTFYLSSDKVNTGREQKRKECFLKSACGHFEATINVISSFEVLVKHLQRKCFKWMRRWDAWNAGGEVVLTVRKLFPYAAAFTYRSTDHHKKCLWGASSRTILILLIKGRASWSSGDRAQKN